MLGGGIVTVPDGVDPLGSTNSATGINNALSSMSTGGVTVLPKGTYKVRSTLTFRYNNSHVVGSGVGNTTIVVDDSAGNIGSAFDITNLYGCGIHNLTISSASARSAGDAIRISGGDGSITGIDVLKPSRTVVEDVDMINQFNGLHVMDSAGPVRNWLVWVDRGYWREFGAGGTGLWINCGNIAGDEASPGASQFFNNLFLSNSDGLSTTAASAIRVSGGGDWTLSNIETWGWTNGFLCDPGAGVLVQAGHVYGCLFDTCSDDTVKITPNATATLTRWKWANNWLGNGRGNGINITGATATDLMFSNVGIHSHAVPGKWAVLMNACDSVTFTGLHMTAGCANGAKFTGSATNCGIIGGRANVTGPRYQVDVGATGYTVVGLNGTGSAAGIDNGGAVAKAIDAASNI